MILRLLLIVLFLPAVPAHGGERETRARDPLSSDWRAALSAADLWEHARPGDEWRLDQDGAWRLVRRIGGSLPWRVAPGAD